MTELRYMGLNQDGLVIFRLTDTDIESNETTMTRYGLGTSSSTTTSQGSAMATGNVATGSSTSNTTTTTIDPAEASVRQLPESTVEFLFDPNERMIELGEIEVEVLSVKAYAITYRLMMRDSQ